MDKLKFSLKNSVNNQDNYRLDPIFKQMVKLRRAFHRQAELAFHERNTAALIIEELVRLDIPYEYGGIGQGIIAFLDRADLDKDKNLPRIALRAEMDALPGQENTQLPFTSVDKNTMHACGHDAHMAMVLGAAALLKASPPTINVTLVFQPAEESGGGSRVMINNNALRDVNAIFGGHVTHNYPVGEVMVNHGVITAQSDRFSIEIKGKGGHGARPHEAIDAIIIAGGLISSIQTVVSREINPLHPSVITIGTLHAGSAANVIAEHAIMEGSIRTTLAETRRNINIGLKRIVKAFETLHDAEIKLTLSEGYPPVINTETETLIAHQAASRVVGESNVKVAEYPSMGSEDFSYYLDHVPGCYVRFGARSGEQKYIPLHSPSFNIDENVLAVGAHYFYQIAQQSATFYNSDEYNKKTKESIA